MACGSVIAQTNPLPQALPYAQDFGASGFSFLPAGLAAWGGLNGGSINSATAAANSAPTADATLTAATTTQSTGGCYGYGTGGNGRFYVQTSSNTTNGANQLAVALVTTGWTALTLDCEVEIVSAMPRTVGIVCQYRVGSSGSWTTLTPSSGQNPFSQSGGTTGVKTSPHYLLPAAAENKPLVQIRWATWRGSEAGNSSGIAVDSIAVTGQTAGTPLSVTVSPTSVSEAAGANASILTVSRTGDFSSALPVTLAISDASEAAYDGPNPLNIPIGQASVSFNLRAVDDAAFDGTQTVTLSVSAPSAIGASASLEVLDDEDVNSPPAGYYDAANGLSGIALKSTLKIIASPANYRSYTYSNTYTPLRSIYEDPANTGNVLTVYSGTSVGKNANYYPGGPSADVSWSREHVWPDSFGLDPTNVNPGDTNGDAGQDYTDLFNLRPCLQTLNSQRSNRYYDETSGADTIPPLAPECSYNTNSWEPRDSEKGDLARTIFYMAMRYDGSDALTYDLEVANTANAGIGRFANLSTLVRWNEQDPVSTEERQRNQNIFANWQRNRNPFIDHPEFIALIWGTVRQSSQVAAVTEGGTTGSYTMQLASAPTANVTINLAVSPGGQVNFSPSSLVFTPTNWDQPQTVNLSAVDDAVHEATLVAQVSHSIASGDARYAVLVPANVAVTVNDNDPVIAPTTLPVNYGGPWTLLPSGFLAQNLGTPYAGSLGGDSGTGSVKFDATGGRLTIGFNTPPAMLTYQLKGNPSSGTATSGTFRVELSTDGVNFTVVRSVSNMNNTDQSFSEPLLLTTRYVSFVLVEKNSGNVQLDKIGISSAPPFQVWLAGFGLSGLDADPGADFDFDGAVNLVDYGLGGSPVKADAASLLPVGTRVGSKFRLTAIVRINDPALSATAQTTVNPGNASSWTSSGVVRLTGVDQSGVAVGFERTIFEVDASNEASRFLRLVFTLN